MKEPLLVEVDLSESGQGKIIIDGKDFSMNVAKIEISSAVGETTTVLITFVNVKVKGKVKCEKDNLH